MKRGTCGLVLMAVSVLLLLLPAAFFPGCGGSKEGRNGATGDDGDTARAAYEDGYSRGRAEGREQGLGDAKAGRRDPQAPEMVGADEDFLRGYLQGWTEGYEEGHAEGEKQAGSENKELAEVEAAMIAFVKQNAAPGLEFRVENIVIHGDMAAGRAVCTSERLESPYVVMKKGASGWYGADFGTGIEPPDWYPY